MTDSDGLEGLQGLHRDLLALAENRLPNLERLWIELEARIEEFRHLLDKPRRNEKSRQKLLSGTIQIRDAEYSVNDDFKQATIQLADALDLDELQSAELLYFAEPDSRELDRPVVVSAIIRFHKRRQFLLECLRLCIKFSIDSEDTEKEVCDTFREFVRQVLGVENQEADKSPMFWQRCLSSTTEIEKWIQQLVDRMQSAQVLGQTPSPEGAEVNTFQLSSLTRQHESLSAICSYLVKAGHSNVDNFRSLLSATRTLDKHDVILVHYVPIIMTFTSRYGGLDGGCSLTEARSLHQTIVKAKDNDTWIMRNFYSAALVSWLAEYSGRYVENPSGSPLQGVNLEAEAQTRSQLFMEALKDGAFHFILSISQDVRPNKWYDSSKAGLLSMLLREAPTLPPDMNQPSKYFQTLMMEQLQSFTDAFITNMPDTLRCLKDVEDQARKELHSRFQRGPVEYEMHLERFLMIIAYAFDGYPDAAQAFWADTDGNLYGFLQWAAKRQPTPRVAAFCEMLRSLSAGEECAKSAHNFLKEEGPSGSGKVRRTSSMCYTQIFNELAIFTESLNPSKKTNASGVYTNPHTLEELIVEPESEVMLESYLRLLAHLCRESSEARGWMLNHSSFDIHHHLFSLLVDKAGSRLRAASFSVIAAFLTNKSHQVSADVWSELDRWAHSGEFFGGKQGKGPSPDLWKVIASTYEESHAFVGLAQALVAPFPDESGLHDRLPFPENLGSSYRQPGIDYVVDFVLDHVFANRTLEMQDPAQQQILRWNCLTFIVLCLASFNEDLVIFANSSIISVDSAIDCSSLSSYVTLHPFARVMEWLFSDKVLKALFASSHQEIGEVDDAPSDSPLVLSLMLSIEVMDLLTRLQSTYLDIVLPLIKSSSQSRLSVSNPVLASFEDSVLNNLRLVVDLGLYCGTGHEGLALVSLKLLGKLSSSRKLVVSPTAGFGQRSNRSKVIGVMEKDNDSERIAKSLSGEMQFDPRELEVGQSSAGFVIKDHILEFLKSCLSAVFTRPTIAHLLLGFDCGSTTVSVADDGLFAKGDSLFHAILTLSVEYPNTVGANFVSWLSTIKCGCLDVLKQLWRSPLTGIHTMNELRANDFGFIQILNQISVDTTTLWDGRTVTEPEFLLSDSAVAYRNFLHQRCAFYDYVARELRLVSRAAMPTLKSRMQSSLLGATIFPTGEHFQNPTIFDLFDFMELEVNESFGVPSLKFLVDLDFDIAKSEEQGLPLYQLPLAEELIMLRRKEMKKSGVLVNQADEQQTEIEEQAILLCLLGENQRQQIQHTQQKTLKAWVYLVMVTLECCDFDQGVRISFVLHALQVILPKLEKSYTDNLTTAIELAGLASVLLQKIDFDSTIFERTKTGDFANDRLSQLFRASLIGIICPVGTSGLREICYRICYRYLKSVPKKAAKGSLLGRHTLRTVKNAGDRLIEVLCDDAYAGQGTCKVSALLVLDALIALDTREDSKYIMEAFIRLNFVGVLVDNIKHIPAELRTATASDVSILLSYYDASLALLHRVCQTRLGATHVLNAGLFQSIRESNIFSADPDIGLEFENPNALKKYFDLMLAVLRVINSAVLSRGLQNDQTVFQAREFLKENRSSMISIFKRNVKVGGLQADIGADLSELVDNFTLLVSVTKFLEYEEQISSQRVTPNEFS